MKYEYRRLSLLGKITDSLTVSKLVYILSPLPINYREIKELTKSLSSVFMERQGEHKRNAMIGDYSGGGTSKDDRLTII